MDKNDLVNRFTYHAPKGNQSKKYMDIRETARLFAVMIHDLCPDSRERSLAITNLEQGVFWANASIARHE